MPFRKEIARRIPLFDRPIDQIINGYHSLACCLLHELRDFDADREVVDAEIADAEDRECDILTSPPEPTMVLHIVPFESMRPGEFVDLEAAMKQAGYLLGFGTGSNGFRYDLDGVLSLAEWDRGQREAYTQLFRKGTMESTNPDLLKSGSGGLLLLRHSGRIVGKLCGLAKQRLGKNMQVFK